MKELKDKFKDKSIKVYIITSICLIVVFALIAIVLDSLFFSESVF